VAPNDSLNNLGDSLQPDDIGIAKVIKLVTINVDNAGNAAVGVKKWDYDLRPCGGTAGNVAWKLFNVGNHDGLSRSIGVPTDAFIEVDPRTGKRPLERPKDKLARLFDIESYPEESESFLQDGGDICKIRYGVALAFDQ